MAEITLREHGMHVVINVHAGTFQAHESCLL